MNNILKTTIKTVNIQLFDARVHIVFTDDIVRERNALFIDHSELGVIKDTPIIGALFTYSEVNPFDYWLFFPGKCTDIGLIAHECFHCTVTLLGLHGIELTYDNNEVGAYLNEFLNKAVYKEFEAYKDIHINDKSTKQCQ